MAKTQWHDIEEDESCRRVGGFMLKAMKDPEASGWWSHVCLPQVMGEFRAVATKYPLPSKEVAQAACEQMAREMARDVLDDLNGQES